METTYYGNATPWYHGIPPGPWIMTDQKNNLAGCQPGWIQTLRNAVEHRLAIRDRDRQGRTAPLGLHGRVDFTYDPMRKQEAILLGNSGDNSNGSQGTFYQGAMTASGTFPSDVTDQLVQANIVAAKYDVQPL